MELALVRRVAGEEAGVAVPRAEQRDDPQHADEELVARELRRAPGEPVHLGLEALPRRRGTGAGWICSIARPRSRTSSAAVDGADRSGLRRRGDRDQREWREQQTRHPHGLG